MEQGKHTLTPGAPDLTDAAAIVGHATAQQRIASDPLVSAWVGASAGSGKTKVLTDRILRLLLPRENGEAGSAPDKILALTFTKAGANEMALRLSRRLSSWAVASREKLIADLEDNLLGRPPREDELDAARKLFARVVDAPGGFNIMTIHSFCQSVLGRFPIESGLPPNFRPLEEAEAAALLDRAKKDVFTAAAKDPFSPMALALQSLSALLNEDQFDALIGQIKSERHQIGEILKRTFGIDGFYTALCTLLDIKPGQSEQQAFAEFCQSVPEEAGLRACCRAFAESKSAADQRKGISIQAFLDAPPDRRAGQYQDYKSVFLNKDNTLSKKLATKDVLTREPSALDTLSYEGRRLEAFENYKKAIVCASLARDLMMLGEAILARYQSLKELQGALDFDDMILRTLSLLKGTVKSVDNLSITPWILYKLDEGIDHVLVDEAQDTNPEQWEIIRLISGEFFTGIGAKDIVRTLFVVGDDKQSIFGFQRAAPEKFGQMHGWFSERIKNSGQTFLPVDITTSFRSVQTVLEAVDTVFRNAASAGSAPHPYLNHIAKRQGQSGIVELWPLLRTDAGNTTAEEEESDSEKGTGDEWYVPDQIVETMSGSEKMARKIGDTIEKWLKEKEVLASYSRPIRPGDIMVLVRARNRFVGQLVRALKARKIPVSGVDRMLLNSQLVVQDMMAAARFALLPEDDLTLACLLKSPFIGMDEEALYTLAYKRSGSLWESLRQNGDGLIVSWLEKLIAHAGADHPYEFFSRIVQEQCPAGEEGGLHAIRARLGEDAMDPLDEFLNLALTYEGSRAASLQDFLQWHTDGSGEIKREMDEGAGAVRIMTVHGAKGLQAPIVFLPDTVRTGAGANTPTLFWPDKTRLDIPLYLPHSDSVPEPLQVPRSRVFEEADREYRRLLYVAMTRAEERLYIGGYTGKKKPAAGGKTAYWYEDIRAAFTALEQEGRLEKIPSGFLDEEGADMPVLRLYAPATTPPDKISDHAVSEDTAVKIALPVWVRQSAPAEPFPPRPLVPSRPSEEEPAAASPLQPMDEFRFRRGNATHKLLQLLPSLPKDLRDSAAANYLARPALSLPPSLQESIAREVMAILDDPAFGPIFGEGSMAEVPVTGLLSGKRLLSGQIDRLLVRDSDVLIIDFKTNRPSPRDRDDIPPAYIAQLSAYADTLRAIYPGRAVRAALLWTDDARLVEVTV